MTVLVTGGAGFIGSNFVQQWLGARDERLVNLDALTYAGNLANLAALDGDPRHVFVRGDIGDRALTDHMVAEHQPRAVIHFAAESHVDRSIHGPDAFIQTNVVGTFSLLKSARGHWDSLSSPDRDAFRFVQISTDEVYGSLAPDEAAFSEARAFAPNSPYSASKAAADHLVRAWFHTYGMPVVTTHCSNNYGAYQFPEKLIPLVIVNALAGAPLPIYGDGQQVRDWLYVDDHVDGVTRVLDAGRLGERYHIGGLNQLTNLDVVRTLCAVLDELRPKAGSYADQIRFVKDRPGHDRRYAMDARKIERELGWRPQHSFEAGLRETVQWYLDHQPWVEAVTSGAYRQWTTLQYGA